MGKEASKFSALTGLVGVVVILIVASSVFVFVRTDSVGKKLQSINHFYLPVIKHLNLLSGKWAGYRRSTEQYLQFRNWGEKGLDLGRPRVSARRLLERDLDELAGLVGHGTHGSLVKTLILQAESVIAKEPERLAGIAVYIKNRQIQEAARVYMELKADHGALSHSISTVLMDLEAEAATRQLAAEQTTHQTATILFVLVGFSLVAVIVLALQLQRWVLPLMQWRKATSAMAEQVARSGFSDLRQGLALPKIDRNTPAEFVLLAREMNNMALTLSEHEKTIQGQKNKLEQLNSHLKGQNEMLRKLGSLNERILNAITNGLIVLDDAQNAEQFNEEFLSMFDVARNTVLGQPARMLFAEFGEAMVNQWLKLEEGAVYRHVRGNSSRYFNIAVQQLPSSGRVISFEDVTALVESEERLAHAQRLALAGNMSAQVAHEVRNPLNSMMLQLEMLEEDVSGPAKARIAQILNQVERLERLTEKYLGVTKQKNNSRENVELPVDAHEVLEQTIEFCSPEIQARQIRLELCLRAASSLVLAERDGLSQVVLNLIRNAIDALDAVDAKDRVIRLTTSTQYQESGAGQFMISVEDAGPGISEAVRSRLFEPFVTTKPHGHGLGLSLSRQICLDHGGDLKFREGSRFEVTLPC